MPAVLRQLQIVETQRCETLAQASWQLASMQMQLYQTALDTNWKDLVLVNTFNPIQDINAFVAFTSTGARCPPPPISGPDAILSPPAPTTQQRAAEPPSNTLRIQQDAASQPNITPSPPHAVPAPERPTLQRPPPLPPKSAAVDGKVGHHAFLYRRVVIFSRTSSHLYSLFLLASAVDGTSWSRMQRRVAATALCAATLAL
jgi:hypothetical protein